MALSHQLAPGMTISVQNKVYRVESSVKVTAPKGAPFIKAKLRDLATQEVVEKNFKLNQSLKDVHLSERKLEFLYPEKGEFLFLDIQNLDQVKVSSLAVGQALYYLKEGIEVKALLYDDLIFSLELPQFLELAVAKTEGREEQEEVLAILETGAKISVPTFVKAGDVIKVDTKLEEYVQRV